MLSKMRIAEVQLDRLTKGVSVELEKKSPTPNANLPEVNTVEK